MEKQTVSCPECKGLGIMGTSVGSNHFRGHDYDCDVCHGTGYVESFNGNVVSQKHSTQQLQPEKRNACV